MIQPGTQLIVQDNSGARIVECITVLKKKGRNFGKSGSFAVVSVKKLRNKGRIKVKKKEICIAMILKTRKNTFRKSSKNVNKWMIISGKVTFFKKSLFFEAALAKFCRSV